MKQFKTLLIAAVLFVGATSFTFAQSKVAHINTTELVQAMPQMKDAKVKMEQLAKTYESDIQAMATELQNKVKLYDSESASKTAEENASRLKEVQEMEQQIRVFQADAQKQLAEKEVEFLKPITEQAKAAILKVAKAQGFDYVLDSAQGGGVIMAEGKNLYNDVKAELGF